MKVTTATGGVLGLTLAALGWAQPSLAQGDVAEFFKDKQIRMVVGSAAGDGYDINARVLVRHLVNHIPGKPSIIIQNQPGAASVPVTNAV